ncbi:MAG: hypothetical protein M1831_003498 [Alyxoria varia]|nr:MAG: hypothetical protein M1831_003498 [Alyxoria varia]
MYSSRPYVWYDLTPLTVALIREDFAPDVVPDDDGYTIQRMFAELCDKLGWDDVLSEAQFRINQTEAIKVGNFNMIYSWLNYAGLPWPAFEDIGIPWEEYEEDMGMPLDTRVITDEPGFSGGTLEGWLEHRLDLQDPPTPGMDHNPTWTSTVMYPGADIVFHYRIIHMQNDHIQRMATNHPESVRMSPAYWADRPPLQLRASQEGTDSE